MRYICVAITLLVAIGLVVGYPSGAGSCKNGPAVLHPDSPHLESDQYKWADSGYKIKFNDNNLILEAGGDGNYFRGFLLRLSNRNGTAIGAMRRHNDFKNISQRLDSTGPSVGLQATCAEGVVGICHTDRSKKTEIVVKMFPEQDQVYRLSVTVVKQEDEWYYTTMRVGLIANKTIGIITDNPTITKENTETKSPTSSPTISPTAESTVATTGTTSPTVSTASSDSPSPAPIPTTLTGRGSEQQTSQVQSTSGAAPKRLTFVLAACTVLLMSTFIV
jgi:hypothetical protein